MAGVTRDGASPFPYISCWNFCSVLKHRDTVEVSCGDQYRFVDLCSTCRSACEAHQLVSCAPNFPAVLVVNMLTQPFTGQPAKKLLGITYI